MLTSNTNDHHIITIIKFQIIIIITIITKKWLTEEINGELILRKIKKNYKYIMNNQ